MESIMDILRTWNKSTTERAKLQHVYIVIVIIVTLVAGLISLINTQLGRQFITVAGVLIVAFVVNAVVWALTRVYLLDRLERKRTAVKR